MNVAFLRNQFLNEARVPHDSDEQIVEIVRDASRQQPDTLEFLLLEKSLLQLLSLRQVDYEAQPLQRRTIEQGGADQHRDAAPVPADIFLFKRSAHARGEQTV